MSELALEQRIEKLMERLSLPLSTAEARDGWTLKSKKAIHDMLADLVLKLRKGEAPPPVNISRGMDSWGITGGDILEEGAEISNQLRAERRKL